MIVLGIWGFEALVQFDHLWIGWIQRCVPGLFS